MIKKILHKKYRTKNYLVKQHRITHYQDLMMYLYRAMSNINTNDKELKRICINAIKLRMGLVKKLRKQLDIKRTKIVGGVAAYEICYRNELIHRSKCANMKDVHEFIADYRKLIKSDLNKFYVKIIFNSGKSKLKKYEQ